MKTELKQCPFCGATPGKYAEIMASAWAKCFISCQCGASVSAQDLDLEDATYRAIQKWNTRVYPPEIQTAIKIAKTAPFSITEE